MFAAIAQVAAGYTPLYLSDYKEFFSFLRTIGVSRPQKTTLRHSAEHTTRSTPKVTKYPTPGSPVMSFFWMRVFAFASNFAPKQASPGAVFGLMVGEAVEAVEGNLAPAGKYGAVLLEAWRSLCDYDFDFRTCTAHRCPDPWSYFYAPAMGSSALRTSREFATLSSDRIELPRYDPSDF